MKTRFSLLLGAVALLLSIQASHAEEELWMTDFEAAKTKAAKEKKDLLIDFTGSDWCIWCQRLKSEVFDLDAFKNEAPKSFILVELDYPQEKEQAEALKEQNKKLAETYEVQGFPTVLLTDATGKTYGRSGYQEGGAEAYVKHLGEMKARKGEWEKHLADAEKAEGVEKAKLLDAALEKMASNSVEDAAKNLADDIKKLDAENQAGLKSKYENRDKLTSIIETLNNTRNVDDALKALDELIALKPLAETLQRAHFFKGQILLKGKGDKDGAIAALKLALDASPKSQLAQQLTKFIEYLEHPPAEEHGPGDGHNHEGEGGAKAPAEK